jgi:hypothetical protein
MLYENNYLYVDAVMQRISLEGKYSPIERNKLTFPEYSDQMARRLQQFRSDLQKLKTKLNEVAVTNSYSIPSQRSSDWDTELKDIYLGFEKKYSSLTEKLVKWSENYFENRIRGVIVLAKDMKDCYRFDDLNDVIDEKVVSLPAGTKIKKTRRMVEHKGESYLVISAIDDEEQYIVNKKYAVSIMIESVGQK